MNMPIESPATAASLALAVVGNGSVGALVSADARIVWCCLPRFDSPPVFDALLHSADGLPAAGAFSIELDGLLLRIALANTGRPPLLVVGNLEQVTSDPERDLLVSRLVELGREQTVVTAGVNGVSDHPVVQIEVENTTRAELANQQKGGA